MFSLIFALPSLNDAFCVAVILLYDLAAQNELRLAVPSCHGMAIINS